MESPKRPPTWLQLKFHERRAHLQTESASGVFPVHSTDAAPGFLGRNISECSRLAATLHRSATRSALESRAFAWGYGSTDGALAHNNTQRIAEPKSVAFFRRDCVGSVSAGNRLSLFLTSDRHEVWQSGRLFGLQDGAGMWKPRPVQWSSEESPPSRVVAIAAGHQVGYALDVEGSVYSWGSQVCGQLGYKVTNEEEAADELEDWGENQPHYSAGEEEDATDEEESAEKQPRPVFVQRRPKRVLMFGPQRRIIKLAVGNHFVLALSESAHVFSWGRNTEGQLGLGDTVTRSEPSRIEALTSYVAMSVSAGHSHALGIFCERREQPQSTYHVVLGWGRSLNGCLGLGGSQPELQPRENLFFRGLQPSQTAAGTDHSLVLCSVGSATYLYAFGGNRFGQLGVGSHEDHLDMPWLVDELMHRRVVSIGAGARYSTALTEDGMIWAWGHGMYGKTARSYEKRSTTFVPWPVDAFASQFTTQLSTGVHHTLGLFRKDRSMDLWRKMPLADGGAVAAFLHPREGLHPEAPCDCTKSQTRTINGSFGLLLRCSTCDAGPLCRACTRRCHAGHDLLPQACGWSMGRIQCACHSSSCRRPDRIPEDQTT